MEKHREGNNGRGNTSGDRERIPYAAAGSD